jgi:hypothetical protein
VLCASTSVIASPIVPLHPFGCTISARAAPWSVKRQLAGASAALASPGR